MELAHHVLGLRHILLDCAGGFGRTLCGLEFELENGIDLEAQTHVNTPLPTMPLCNVSVDIFHPTLSYSLSLIKDGRSISTTPNFG